MELKNEVRRGLAAGFGGRGDIRRMLAEALKTSEPRLYAAIDALAARGESKSAIKAAIRPAFRGRDARCLWGCCEAAVDVVCEEWAATRRCALPGTSEEEQR